MDKKKDLIIEHQMERIKKLEAQLKSAETAVQQLGEALDAILIAVCKKYGSKKKKMIKFVSPKIDPKTHLKTVKRNDYIIMTPVTDEES